MAENDPGKEPDPTPDEQPDQPDDDAPPHGDEPDWKTEARKWEKRAKENSDAAARLKEIEDEQKSEQQKLADQLEDARNEGASAKTEAARLRAAIKYGLSEDDLDLLGTGTADEIEDRAARLAKRLGLDSNDDDEDEPRVTRRPKERLRPGATPSSEPEETDPIKLAAQVPRMY